MVAEYESLLSRFSSQRILVVGDVMLDRYWFGEVSRISPEAPVPIVRMLRSSCYPGGAGNVALNISSLGATVSLVALVGDDKPASELRGSLSAAGVVPDLLFVDLRRMTTTKTRIIANKQQVVRMDEEETHSLSPEQETEVLRILEGLLKSCDCAVVSDYAKGFISSSLVSAFIAAARSLSVPVLVDPKSADATRYRGATLIKPNRAELSLLTGVSIRCHSDALEACETLSCALPDVVILATEGPDGMTLRLPGREYAKFPTRALEVFDVTGAGDTVIAVASVAIASGADPSVAAHLANCAAGIVVGDFGCGKVSIDRLLAVLNSDLGPEIRGDTPDFYSGARQ